jgi:hypothetical protein
MATQRRADSTSEADSYEHASATATAFLSVSDWIEEDSLLFSAAHQPHPHRPFSPSVPDLPSPSGTLRRHTAFSNDGGTNNDTAINSLVNSLRTSLVFHEQHQEDQNRPSQMSPSCLGAVLCEEPTSAGGGSIPPLPFGARPTPMQQSALDMFRDHQQGGASYVRSASAGTSLRSTKGSRYVPCSSAFRRSRSI